MNTLACWLWLPLATQAAAASPPAPPAPPVQGAEDPAQDWTSVSAAWEAALHDWASDWYSRWKKDPSTEFEAAPTAEFWDRFAAVAATGETRAMLWLLWNLDQVGAGDALRKERARALFDKVREAGDAGWVAEAIPALLRTRWALDEGAFVGHLMSLSGPTSAEEVRRAALLAQVAFMDDPAWILEMQLFAFAEPNENLGPLEELSDETLDELAETVEDALNAASSAHFQKWNVNLGDMYVQIPGAPANPETTHQPILEALAERGSAHAALWCLRAIWPSDDGTRDRLRGYLRRVAVAELDPDQLQELSWYVSSIVSKVGAEPTESAVRQMLEKADDETKPKLLAALGEGLCSDPATRERGLALLRDIVANHPDSDAAKDAAGKLFRFEKLVVGNKVPDFETVDVDDNAFRLSDYEGKVTVVDFWGFW